MDDRKIDSVGPDAIPALIKALETEGRGRFYAVFFLQKLGPQAKEALPALKKLRGGDSGRFRGFLDRAIRAIEKDED